MLFVTVPVQGYIRRVREVYPEIEPEKEGNLADGLNNLFLLLLIKRQRIT